MRHISAKTGLPELASTPFDTIARHQPNHSIVPEHALVVRRPWQRWHRIASLVEHRRDWPPTEKVARDTRLDCCTK